MHFPPANATVAWAGLSWLCALLGSSPNYDWLAGKHNRFILHIRKRLPADFEAMLRQQDCGGLTADNVDGSARRHFKGLLSRLNRDLHDAAGLLAADSPADTPPSAANDEFWPPEIRLLMSVIFVGLSTIGMIGNLLVITTVLKVPGMITPTNCYLTSLAVSDSLFFVAAAPTEISYLHVSSTKYIFDEMGCAIFSYLPYLAINTSSLSITAFTIERFIGICYPLRARYICTVKRAKHILLLVWTFCILYNSPWLYLATLKQDAHGQVCGFKLERDSWAYKAMFLNDFVSFYLIPMILYVFMYAKIVCTLSRCGFHSPELSDHHRVEIPTFLYLEKCYSAASRPLVVNSQFHDSPIAVGRVEKPFQFAGAVYRRNSTRGKVQVVKMLALVVLVFAVCWLPYRVMVMHNSFVSDRLWDEGWYIFLSKTLVFFNCSINPILYNVMSSRFRCAFRRLLNENSCWPKAAKPAQ